MHIILKIMKEVNVFNVNIAISVWLPAHPRVFLGLIMSVYEKCLFHLFMYSLLMHVYI